MIIHTLKHTLSEEEFKIVIRSLRQDAIIWSALQDPQLINRLKSQKFKELDQWSPANIALTHIQLESKTDLFSKSSSALDQETLSRASDMLESVLSPIQSPETDDQLAVAAYAALALRERWNMLDAIEDSLFDLVPKNSGLWKTTLSVLFGLTPIRQKILDYLFSSTDTARHGLALHLVSSQPLSIQAQALVLTSCLQKLPTLQRSLIMQTLREQYPTLAKQTAEDLLKIVSEIQPEGSDSVHILISLMERTELLKVQGQYQDVLPALDQIRKLTTNLQADLTAQLAQAAARGNDQETAIEAIQLVSDLENELQLSDSQSIALAQINTGMLDPKHLDEQPADNLDHNLHTLLTAVKAASQKGQDDKAQQYAQQAYQETLNYLKKGSVGELLTPNLFQTLIEILISVQLIEEAVQIAREGQERYPNNTAVIQSYALALFHFGKFDQAVEQYTIAVALSEDDPTIQRELIKTLIAKEDWIEARIEAEKLVLSQGTTNPEDYLFLAECYLMTDQLSDAVTSCQQGLVQDPENWSLLRMLGRIHQQLNDLTAAQKYFSQAIVHHPEMIEAWLELSELHQQNNQPDEALEKLLSAANVNPECPDLQLHIGLLYKQIGDPIKSLAAFNQAARFIHAETSNSTRKQIAINLGKSLSEGGYIDEAVTVFEKAHKDHPADSQIAYLYARTLIHAGSTEQAFPILTLVTQIPGAPIKAHLDYAEAILQLSKSPELALEHIHIGLKADPEDERARILLAKATAASENHTAAIELYQEALQTELSRQPNYFIALTVGIAQSAFKTKQPHLAVTFLKEGLRQFPNSLEMKKSLCQAYIHTNLKPDALAILEEIKADADNSLENLIWIADQAIALKELQLATTVLNEASQISPNNSEIIVRLGYAQLEGGQEAAARQTFGQLFEVADVDISDMKLAAHALVGVGDILTSIPFIEKALELCDYQSSDLLSDLTQLYLQADQPSMALETVQKNLEISPQDPSLWITQSEILLQLGRTKAAIRAIEQALGLSPTSAVLHSQAAVLYRQEDNLSASLDHIQQAIEHDPASVDILHLAAGIFRASLMDDKAFEAISSFSDQSPTAPDLITRAELLFAQKTTEAVSLANQSINHALKYLPENPRGLAVKARMLYFNGQETEARSLFDQAHTNYTGDNFGELDRFEQVEILLSIGETALILGQWDQALTMAELAVSLTPQEPRPHLFISKANTLRAEFQHACSTVKVHTHSPGTKAVDETSLSTFDQAISALYELAPNTDQAARILKWEQRGQYALRNQTPFKKPVLRSAADFAALIAASRRSEEQIDLSNVQEDWLNDAAVRFQLSLSYAVSDIHNAVQIAEDLAQTHPNNPVYLANFAMLAYRSKDLPGALKAIGQALDIWPDEPYWHVFASSLESEKNNHSKAIDHLEKACCIQDDAPDYLFQLGAAYLKGGLPGNAIRVLEEVVNLQPLEPEYWATLSQAFQEADEIDQASTSIEKAAKLSPKSAKYQVQAAEIAHLKGTTIRRDQFIEQAISLQPRDPADIIRLTNLLLDQDKNKEAMQLLDQFIDLSISPTQLQLQKAAIVRKTKGVHEEIKMLVDMVKKEPRNPFTLARLCESYLKINQPQDAIKAGQFAIKHGRDVLSTSRLSKLNYQVGILFRRSGQLDQAVSHLSKSINLTPHFVDAYLEIGKALKERREYKKALTHLEKAINVAPQDPRPYLHAGLLLKEGTDYLGAETMLNQAAALAPDDVNIKRQLAAVIAMAIIHQNENR